MNKKTLYPTIDDVALAAGVSTATVSRAINEPDKVAKPTRERIQSVIHEMGYTPNHGGRVLASNRSNTVGAIIPTMENAMFASGLQAFQEELAKAGVTLLVATNGYDSKEELKQIKSLMAHGADGLLLIGGARTRETLKFLKLRNTPYVISWFYKSDSRRVYAGFDNSKAACEMATRVLESGHRRIAMIAGESKGNDRASHRIEGVVDAVDSFGDGATLSTVLEVDYSLESGGDAFEQLMSETDAPTAIICGNDVLAAGAVVRAREKGIEIPRDVSVTGFDDINLATVVSPSLTTVRVPQIEMGRAAALLLLEQLFEGTKPVSIEFETEIIERQSLAAPLQRSKTRRSKTRRSKT